LILVDPSLGFVFFWVSHLFLGNQRNKTQFLDLQLRQSIVPWPQQHVNLFGFFLYLWIFRFIILKLLYFSVIARLHYTLLQTQYFMNTQSIFNLIVISFEKKNPRRSHWHPPHQYSRSNCKHLHEGSGLGSFSFVKVQDE
jgi:hypothetical protein